MKYPILFKQDVDNTTYTIKVPDLAGCQITTSSVDIGFQLITKVIEDHLRILAEYGENIPTAKPISYYLEKNQEQYQKVIWALIDIDITPFLGKSHKINVTLPELLIKQIDDRVSKSEHYKTRSGFIASACIKELQK